MMEIDKDMIARRLSGAFGKRVDPTSIESAVRQDLSWVEVVVVKLADGEVWRLFPGNEPWGGPLQWWKNGQTVAPVEGREALMERMAEKRLTK